MESPPDTPAWTNTASAAEINFLTQDIRINVILIVPY